MGVAGEGDGVDEGEDTVGFEDEGGGGVGVGAETGGLGADGVVEVEEGLGVLAGGELVGDGAGAGAGIMIYDFGFTI